MVPMIAQVEFHVPLKGSLGVHTEEHHPKQAEGEWRTTVVRFYDMDGRVARSVQKLNSILGALRRSQDRFLRSSRRGIMRQLCSWHMDRLYKRRNRHARQTLVLSIRCLGEALRVRDAVAIVPASEASFRLIQDSEKPELLERVSEATAAFFLISQYEMGELCCTNQPGKLLISFVY